MAEIHYSESTAAALKAKVVVLTGETSSPGLKRSSSSRAFLLICPIMQEARKVLAKQW